MDKSTQIIIWPVTIAKGDYGFAVSLCFVLSFVFLNVVKNTKDNQTSIHLCFNLGANLRYEHKFKT